MFAQESVMDIQRQAFQEWYIANHHDGDIHPNQQLLEWSEKGGFYFASSVEDLWEAWQAAKAQAVPKWISVDDELPSEGDLLLGISTTKLAKFNVYQVVALDEFDDCEITHWMHLPQAPKAQEQSHE